jgi:hypothetical protein
LEPARLYFDQALDGLVKGQYVREVDGMLRIAGKGAPERVSE